MHHRFYLSLPAVKTRTVHSRHRMFDDVSLGRQDQHTQNIDPEECLLAVSRAKLRLFLGARPGKSSSLRKDAHFQRCWRPTDVSKEHVRVDDACL